MIDPQQPDYRNTPVSPSRPRFHYRLADPKTPPAVSIVTPFYNTGDIFRETAASVFQQSLQAWEWLIINDGSDDPAALAVLDAFRDCDARVRVIDLPENRGPGAARNTGYEAARCAYVCQLDDDDLLEPTAIETWLWHLESNPQYAIANGWSVAFGAKEYLWPNGFERGDKCLQSNYPVGRALVRKSAHAAAGGFDETMRSGMEDWDFWMRCAAAGLWGSTVPEFHDWYRRRENHGDRWALWAESPDQPDFLARQREKYPKLFESGVPRPARRWRTALEPIRTSAPCSNVLEKPYSRALLIAPWMSMGGSDKVNLDLIDQLLRRGWEASVVTTMRSDDAWRPQFTRRTPDVFAMPNFLRDTDYPAFLRYLIESRRPDVVFISNSELGYQLLPYLRAVCPEPAYVDYCHSEQPAWKHGGYPRYSIANQDLLDGTGVTSQYLKDWMVRRGGDAGKTTVVTINVDAEAWRRRDEARSRVRAAHNIPDDRMTIVFAGRLHADKQPRVLGRTLLELTRRGADFHALVIGDGPDGKDLRAFIQENDLLARVTMCGARPNEQVRELMSAGDIFFLPSLWEGIALTIYEAMAAGLAIVAADVGGQRELVTPDCGLLLPRKCEDEAGEARAYADVLADLLADAERTRALGAAARRRIEDHFTLEKMGEAMLKLFADARARHAACPVRLTERIGIECATQAIEQLRLSEALGETWVDPNEGALENTPQARLIRELENERDAAWAEAQRMARGWEAQHAHIQHIESRLKWFRRTSILTPIWFVAKHWPLRPLFERLRNGRASQRSPTTD
ncbi:MAG: glycosyltransferase [Planctomycetota bacterium]|nr:MAG: glycosyltransferase [Planctomycetota bacterium]